MTKRLCDNIKLLSARTLIPFGVLQSVTPRRMDCNPPRSSLGSWTSRRLDFHVQYNVQLHAWRLKNFVIIITLQFPTFVTKTGFSYKVVDGWPKGGATTGQLSQEKQMPVIGQIAGVEVTKDHVIIFHRAKRVWDAT